MIMIRSDLMAHAQRFHGSAAATGAQHAAGHTLGVARAWQLQLRRRALARTEWPNGSKVQDVCSLPSAATLVGANGP